MAFEWDKSIDAANLKAAKMAQTRNHCEKIIIKRLEAYWDWADYVCAFNPDLPEIIRPERPTEIYFVLLQRYFVLRYREEGRVWRLYFLWRIENKKADGGDAGGGANAEPNERRAVACAAPAQRRRRMLRGFNWEEFDNRARLLFRVIEPKIELAASRVRWSAARLWRRLEVAYATAVGETHGPPASLSQLVRGSLQAHAARTRAHLERCRVSLAPGLDIDLFALVHEIDWNSYPFGIREDQLVLA